MDSIVLMPYRFRDATLAPAKQEEAFELSWDDAVKQLVPESDRNPRAAKLNLRFARIGDFVGTRKKFVRGKEVPTSFIIAGRGTGNDLGWLLKMHPEFPKTVVEIYRVEQVRWPAEMVTEPAA
jgi:hypothetical protein